MDSKTIVLITGGNTGIGYQTASALAASDVSRYHIILTSRDLTRGQKAMSDLQGAYPSSSFALLQLDVTSEASITACAKSVSEAHGRLDVLISNAGMISHLEGFAGLRETFETNTFGPVVLTEVFTPLLLKSKGARLVYVTSGLGSLTLASDKSHPFYNVPDMYYRMSKSALNMLALTKHKDLGPKGVKVWTYCPGYVVTNLSRTGEKGIQERVERGAVSPKDSAQGIVALVEGKRDADAGKFVNRDGVFPW